MSIGKLIIKIIVAALAIAITAFFVPGMSNEGGVWSLVLAAIVIGLLDWLILKVTKVDASPFGRGIVGFLVAAVILYVTGMIVDGFTVTLFGAIIGALILGVVDMFIPGDKKVM